MWRKLHGDEESKTEAMEVGSGAIVRVTNWNYSETVSVVFVPDVRVVEAGPSRYKLDRRTQTR